MAGSLEKKQGHEAEHSVILHNKIKSLMLIEGEVTVDGTSGTKTDLMIGSIRFSQKTPSGKNTQVWLPTKIPCLNTYPVCYL